MWRKDTSGNEVSFPEISFLQMRKRVSFPDTSGNDTLRET